MVQSKKGVWTIVKRTYLYVLISTFLFSSMEISLKLAGSSFNGIQLNFLRFLVGGVFLLPFAVKALRASHNQIRLSDIGIFALTGFCGIVVSMTLFQLAVEVDQASTVAVLFSCNPVFALIFSYLILREKLSRTNLLAVIISIVGLLIIVNPAHLNNPLGLTLSITSAITFGLYSIISRWGSGKRGFNGLTMTSLSFLAGAAELAILMGISHIGSISTALTNAHLDTFASIPFVQGVSMHSIVLLAYICLGVTAGGFGFYFLAMETSDVSTASLVFFIKPALAPIMALFILHDQILVNTVAGIVVIIIGSVITFMGNRLADQSNKMAYSDVYDKLNREPGTPGELHQKLENDREQLHEEAAAAKAKLHHQATSTESHH